LQELLDGHVHAITQLQSALRYMFPELRSESESHEQLLRVEGREQQRRMHATEVFEGLKALRHERFE